MQLRCESVSPYANSTNATSHLTPFHHPRHHRPHRHSPPFRLYFNSTITALLPLDAASRPCSPSRRRNRSASRLLRHTPEAFTSEPEPQKIPIRWPYVTPATPHIFAATTTNTVMMQNPPSQPRAYSQAYMPNGAPPVSGPVPGARPLDPNQGRVQQIGHARGLCIADVRGMGQHKTIYKVSLCSLGDQATSASSTSLPATPKPTTSSTLVTSASTTTTRSTALRRSMSRAVSVSKRILG